MKRLRERRRQRRLNRQLRHHYVHSRGCFICNMMELFPSRRVGKILDSRPLEEVMESSPLMREWWQDSLLDKLMPPSTVKAKNI